MFNFTQRHQAVKEIKSLKEQERVGLITEKECNEWTIEQENAIVRIDNEYDTYKEARTHS